MAYRRVSASRVLHGRPVRTLSILLYTLTVHPSWNLDEEITDRGQCRTGYGQHGDYLFGWENDSLQRAMDTCTDIGGDPNSCRALTVQTDAQINACKLAPVVNEQVEGTCECYLLSFPLEFCLVHSSIYR